MTHEYSFSTVFTVLFLSIPLTPAGFVLPTGPPLIIAWERLHRRLRSVVRGRENNGTNVILKRPRPGKIKLHPPYSRAPAKNSNGRSRWRKQSGGSCRTLGPQIIIHSRRAAARHCRLACTLSGDRCHVIKAEACRSA